MPTYSSYVGQKNKKKASAMRNYAGLAEDIKNLPLVQYAQTVNANKTIPAMTSTAYKQRHTDSWTPSPVVTNADTNNAVETDPLQNYIKSKYGDVYDAQLAQLDLDKRAQEQEAYINHQIMMKYLPQLNKESGVYGLGISGSNAIEANNAYQTALAQAQLGYDTQKANLLQNYAAQYEAEKKADQDAAYSALNALGGDTVEDVKRYYDIYKERLSDTQKSDVENYIKALQSDEDNAEKSQTSAKISTISYGSNLGRDGDNFTVTDADGNRYKVESGGKADNDIQRVLNGKNDGVYKYNGQLYIVSDGIAYVIRGRYNDKSGYNSLKKLYGIE